MPPTAAQVRQEFLDFFVERHGHASVPSSPVIPHDDPTLLFANAGMNQFKDVFLGKGIRPYARAANSQKCIRAGGKHNDLEDVGRDTYHHTFFEMLGNWSFGDYFKEEAITWAWELLTDVWGLDKSRLHVTVFAGDEDDGLAADDESADLWTRVTDVDAAHITRWGRKDNFWEMGESGPCGPCSEIHYDCTPGGDGAVMVNQDHPDVIELWNLVFIQFNRGSDGVLSPLPARHVDTGMGLERIVRTIQGKASNYDTDLWTPLFDAIADETDTRSYTGALDDPVDIAYRVIADHVRCLAVAISDGGRPGAAGREYVLRRILRRAARHARQTLGVDRPVLARLVPPVVDLLGDAFPGLREDPDAIARVIEAEEEGFLRTLDRGLALFAEAADACSGEVIDAQSVFALHDTFGFPVDLTQVMASERGLSIDRDGYEALMAEARETSRGGGEDVTTLDLPASALRDLQLRGVAPTDDGGRYAPSELEATVLAAWDGTSFQDEVAGDATVALLLDRTPFYSESGGQVADTGHLGDGFSVQQVQRAGNWVLHIGQGNARVGDRLTARIAGDHRRQIEANHTATHLLNLALRTALGDGIDQKGSLVAGDRLRFDFALGHALDDEQIMAVEEQVRAAIGADLAVHAGEVPLAAAQEISGVRAVFGEQYPDPVRVVSIGAPIEDLLADPDNERWRRHSIEFCGGTHLATCGDASHFVVLHEQALAAGIRRITALTSDAANEATRRGRALLEAIEHASSLDDDDLMAQFDALRAGADDAGIPQIDRHKAGHALDVLSTRVKQARKASSSSRHTAVMEQAVEIADREETVTVELISGGDRDSMLSALDAIRARRRGGAAMLFTVVDDGVLIVAGVDGPLIERGLHAGDWIKAAAQACGGGGGGRPDTAQAGGKDPDRVNEAMDVARRVAQEATA